MLLSEKCKTFLAMQTNMCFYYIQYIYIFFIIVQCSYTGSFLRFVIFALYKYNTTKYTASHPGRILTIFNFFFRNLMKTLIDNTSWLPCALFYIYKISVHSAHLTGYIMCSRFYRGTIPGCDIKKHFFGPLSMLTICAAQIS